MIMKAALAGLFAAAVAGAACAAGGQQDDPDQSFVPGPPPAGQPLPPPNDDSRGNDSRGHGDGAPSHAADVIGDSLAIDELDGQWVGTWTRRPGADTFDAVWRNRQGQEAHDVIRLAGISGNQVTFVRQGVSGPAGGTYTGTISADGRSIRGTASWYQPGWFWTAQIGGRASSHGDNHTAQTDTPPDHGSHGWRSQPPQPPQEAKLVDNWNTGGCGFTDTATLDVGAATRLTKITLWYNWQAGESGVPYVVTSGGRQVGAGTLRRGSCDPYQGAWCEAVDAPNANLSPGHYRFRLQRGALCQNGGSGGAGFIRAWGYPTDGY